MKQLIEIKKKIASDWFKFLQDKIIDEFQLLENESSKKGGTKKNELATYYGKNDSHRLGDRLGYNRNI